MPSSDGNGTNQQKRKRGVKASRSKLENARIKAGFASQKEIASRIAEIEKTESTKIPKDMVYRVFSGKPVDPKSIERVAIALNVTAYSLYLSTKDIDETKSIIKPGEDAAVLPDHTLNEHSNAQDKRFYTLFIVALFISIILLTMYSISTQNRADDSNNTQQKDVVSLGSFDTTKPLKIALIQTKNSPVDDMLEQLNKNIEHTYRYGSVSYSDISEVSTNPLDASKVLNADAVVVAELNTLGRYVRIDFTAYSSSKRATVLSEVLLASEFMTNPEPVYARVNRQLTMLLGYEEPSAEYSFKRDNPEASKILLTIMNRIDTNVDDRDVGLHIAELERILQIAPGNTQARIQLCMAYNNLYLVRANNEYLDKAFDECDSVTEKALQNPAYYMAMATYHRRQNEIGKATEYIDKGILVTPNNVDLFIEKAETELRLLLQTRDKHHLEKAFSAAKKAIDIEPNYWKSHFTLARINASIGRPQESLKANEKSIELMPRPENLSNAGTINYCYGDAEKARKYYIAASKFETVRPETFYNLSTIYYYFDQSDLAVQAYNQYLNNIEAKGAQSHIDALIGSWEIYRQANMQDKAIAYMKEARGLIETKLLDTPQDIILQYQSLLVRITIEKFEDPYLFNSEREQYVAQLQEIQQKLTNPNHLARLLFLYLEIDEVELARPIYEKVAVYCRGFANIPRFKRSFEKAE